MKVTPSILSIVVKYKKYSIQSTAQNVKLAKHSWVNIGTVMVIISIQCKQQQLRPVNL